MLKNFLKKLIGLNIVTLALCHALHAESVSIKDLDTAQESTTIEIKKGSISSPQMKKEYQMVDDSNEVVGDSAPLKKAAQENWKKACESWKKEVKDLNKENKVIALNCGKMVCNTTAMETTCSSDGKSKVRVIISE